MTKPYEPLTHFRCALMACGLTVARASAYLGITIRQAEDYAAKGGWPEPEMTKLRRLHQRIMSDETLLPDGSEEMQRVIFQWRLDSHDEGQERYS